jgi:hypothetical protein
MESRYLPRALKSIYSDFHYVFVHLDLLSRPEASLFYQAQEGREYKPLFF